MKKLMFIVLVVLAILWTGCVESGKQDMTIGDYLKHESYRKDTLKKMQELQKLEQQIKDSEEKKPLAL